ncbi:MAG: hypothetical protein HUJ25_05665 [Crocinitomicaceae bacterium]|nr:hypothetical protein [Crocinitomicaceae bacterium]
MKSAVTYLFLIGLVLVACKKEPVELDLGTVDASRYVAIGTDATAGYSDDALHYDGQISSYANILATQLSATDEVDFNQPLLSENSVGINLNNDAKLVLDHKTDCKDTVSLSPVRIASQGDIAAFSQNTYSSAPFDNLGVPGLSFLDVATVGYGNSSLGAGNYNPYFTRMTSSETNGSILGDALARNPTFFTVMLGDADIMDYATSGGTSGPIPPSSGADGVGFDGTLNAMLLALTGAGAKGAIATIPDVTDFPYFTTIPYNGLTLDADKAQTMNDVFNPIGLSFVEGDNPFTMECDCNQPYNVRKMVEGELILLSIPLDSVKCNGMGSIVPIPDKYVLTLAEINELQTKIDEYNAVIVQLAQTYDLAVVERAELISELKEGIIYNGVAMSTEFVSGGAFSLDGRNLNPKGQALLANKFIAAINAKFNAAIPYADVTKYDGILFP